MDPDNQEFYEDILFRILNPHPLLIPAIVQSILSEFSYADLKKFRLVCTSWEYEASIILKNQTQIRLRTEENVLSYTSDLELNYCCDSYEFGPEIPLISPQMETFFNTFGCDIKSLKLHQVSWSGPELWYILSEKLPYLQELSIRIFIPRGENDANFLPPTESNENLTLPSIRILKLNFSIEKPFKPSPPPPIEVTHPTILKELFLAMPNIEEIYCPSWPTYIRPDKNVGGLFYNVIFEYPEIKFDKLSYIHINAPLDNIQLYKLMDKNFPLKELRLELCPEVKPYFFYLLLKSLEKTLKTLILIFHADYDAENFDDFPILKNLEYVSLHKYCGPIDVIVKYLPNLKTLLLNDSYVTDNDNASLDEWGQSQPRFNLNTLEELVIEGVTYSPYGQLVILARNFPNLKKLSIQHVDDTMLRVIFMRLGHLHELIADGKFTDAGISGIPLDICQNIFEVPDVDKARIFPYIGRLTDLRRLELNSYAMSYLSVLLGVNDCKKLKYKRISSPQILPFNPLAY